jgi:acetolactate synthase-1/2/3 large subunit
MVEKADIEQWRSTVEEWKQSYTIPIEETGSYLSPGRVIKEISREFPDAIISTEVGQNQMWAALFYNFQASRTWLTSGGLGTMGYGFPAAIGAQIGNPDKRVIDIAGDGSIQMNIQEMATAVIEGLPENCAIHRTL